jgi:hypothetical protein
MAARECMTLWAAERVTVAQGRVMVARVACVSPIGDGAREHGWHALDLPIPPRTSTRVATVSAAGMLR